MKIDITDDQRFDRECDFMQDRGFTLCDEEEGFEDTCWIPPRHFTEKEQEVIEQELEEISWYPYPIVWDLIKKEKEL